tara:strand:- start:56 stop:373 length:318 start_codon:yes stop_codon:yes gene_type:complete
MSLIYDNKDHTVIHRTEDGARIPVYSGNADYDTIISEGLTVADYVAPDETMDSIRAKRNQLLKDTDWQASSDRTMSDAETTYRQALRDLPSTNSDPTKIVFPDAP